MTRISISKFLTTFNVFVVIGLLAVAGVGGVAVNTLRVGSPIYDQIIASKDLVADILPPPLYVIEAFLEVNLAQDNPDLLPDHLEKLGVLHKEYDERRAYWLNSSLPSELKSKLIDDSDREAQIFWSEIDQSFLPAVAKGDPKAVSASYNKIAAAYSAHRKVIDQVVAGANAFSTKTEADAEKQKQTFMGFMTATTVAVLIFLIAAIWFMRVWLTKPLSALSEYMRVLGDDRHDEKVPSVERADEIGAMARAVDAFRLAIKDRVAMRAQRKLDEEKQKASWKAEEEARVERERARNKVIDALARSLGELSGGDLLTRLDKAFPSEFETLRHDFNAAVNSLRGAMTIVATAIAAVTAGTHDITKAADELSQRSEQQAASLEETAAALDQITNMVRETSENAEQAGRMVSETKNRATKSGEVVGEAVDAMARIEQSADQITQIIGVINEISFQTNLLALNAGVEAARAGEAGKGFAVVAQEVRALAQRSSDAAKEIRALIDGSSVAVATGVALVKQTGGALQEMVDEVSRIDERVATISAAARDQATSLKEINVAVNEMGKITQRNAAMVEETTAASHGLQEEAHDLKRALAQFKLGAAPVERVARSVPARVEPRPASNAMPGRRGGGALRKPKENPEVDDWKEF